jgi:hypothetical protein
MRGRSHPWDRVSLDFIMGLMAKAGYLAQAIRGFPAFVYVAGRKTPHLAS